jgi:hypothetical protein
MKEGDLIDELVIDTAKSCRQGFSLTLGSGRSERHERFEQFVGLHLFTRFSRVEADWFEARLDFGGARLGASHGEKENCIAAAIGDRNRHNIDGRETQVPGLVSKDRPLPNSAGPNI